MPMTHAPETSTENPYQKTCTSFLQVCHANRYRFFWYRNLVRSRTMFYSVQEILTKMTSADWSTIASCVVCLYKLCCLLFYCFKINWGDNSIEKLIQKFCFLFQIAEVLVFVFWSNADTGIHQSHQYLRHWCFCHIMHTSHNVIILIGHRFPVPVPWKYDI